MTEDTPRTSTTDVTGATIDAVEASVYTVPTDAPEADGTYAWNSTTMTLVQVHCGDVVGTGWTYGPPACASVVRGKLADIVVGSEAMDVGAILATMIKQVRNAGRVGAVGYAISAIDIALWDLKARLLGLPLHHLLGAVRPDVPLYGSGGFTTYSQTQMVDQLDGWTSQGFPRVKIKIGESWGNCTDRDLERMAQAREAIGTEIEFFVDANGAYGRKQAIRVMREAENLNIGWYEEPVSSDDLAGLREVRNHVLPDVTAGEYGFDIYYFRRMCEANAVDCLQVDASRCGGISEWMRAAAVAASYGLDVSGHCGPHLHAHVAAATPNFRHLEWFHDHVRIESMFFDGTLDPAGGVLTPDSSASGLGLTLRVPDIEQFRVG